MLPYGRNRQLTDRLKCIHIEGGGRYIVALQNGKNIAAELRRSKVIELKITGKSEAVIAKELGVSASQVYKDVKQRLNEVRRLDVETVDELWALQDARYSRLLAHWWPTATDGHSPEAVKAVGIVLEILKNISVIGGVIPDKPLIKIDARRQTMMNGSQELAYTQECLKHEDVRKAMDELAQVIEKYPELMDWGAQNHPD